MSGTVIKRVFRNQVISSAGNEIPDILGSNYRRISGFIEQIVIEQISGAATTVDVQIRYESGNSGLTDLVYQFTGGTLDFIDSQIDAPFSLRPPDEADNLFLFIEPDSTATFDIRIDFRITQ